ncbi:PLP-dependent cysteine synthase family protein, partial [Candidatus Poribacteria bacterium]
MARIYRDITETIGDTPLVKLNYVTQRLGATVVVKLESFNPMGCVKERIAIGMIEDAEARGLIDKNSLIIEPTSGNTGIGLALVCATRRYKLILTMSERMSIERRMLLKAIGAEIVLTPGDKGTRGAIRKAEELLSEIPNSFMPNQFKNPAN